ncbi:hypothetical protein SY27_04150 [Flavobacterium sp. 316]|uniref:hypothetical protein n=1 Tax=Flavobacterium sp. 316 TaxID=1603293 RepID=UPI0005E36F07|nr:hypothetical protein [Flavobacterium sp. 316]KIX21883.1 hypothetical protein SY27_04150 [Flavobacterium sp. 316]
MKKLALLFLGTYIIFACSCDKDEQIFDESIYYNNDTDCNTVQSGTCCDIDGRILVNQNTSYTYNHNNNYDATSIEWIIISGDITLIEGQNTNLAKFHFGNNFVSGEIKAISNNMNSTQNCVDVISINLIN